MVDDSNGQKKAGNLRFQRKIISHEKNYIFIFTLKKRKILSLLATMKYISCTANIYFFSYTS
jgi:hypothetical protein